MVGHLSVDPLVDVYSIVLFEAINTLASDCGDGLQFWLIYIYGMGLRVDQPPLDY